MNENDFLGHLRNVYKDRDTTNFNIFDFISAFGSPIHALMYSKLFWPDFIEIDNMVFLKETFEDEEDRLHLEKARRRGLGITEIEQRFNLFEIPSYFFATKKAYEMSDEEDQWLAQRLAEMWKCRLQISYPGRRFVVKVINPEETGGEISIIFHQTTEK